MMPRYRCRKNRDPELGMRNRQWGLSKKANTFQEWYNADVVVVIRRRDGRYGGYQSRPGLVRALRNVPEDQLFGPNDFISESKKDAIDTEPAFTPSPPPTRSTSASSYTNSVSSLASCSNFSSSFTTPSPSSIIQSSTTSSESSIDYLTNDSRETTPRSMSSIGVASPEKCSTALELCSPDEPSRAPTPTQAMTAATPPPSSLANDPTSVAKPMPISMQKTKDILDLLDVFF